MLVRPDDGMQDVTEADSLSTTRSADSAPPHPSENHPKPFTIKLLDLGLARVLCEATGAEFAIGEELTGWGDVMGTADYMAPEQATHSRHADQRSDIYALGCTLFRLLTDQPVFPEGGVLDRLIAHREAPVPSPKTLRADVPDWLDLVCRQMLAKRPEDRQASMDVVIRQLAERTSRTSQLAPSRRYANWQRSGLKIAASLLCAAALAAAAGWLYRVSDQGAIVVRTFDPDVQVVVEIERKQEGVTAASAERQNDRFDHQQALRETYVAEWVVEVGGRLVVNTVDGKVIDVRTLDELPAEPFRIRQIKLIRLPYVTNASLVHLRDAQGLESLFLNSSAVTGDGLKHLANCRQLQELSVTGVPLGRQALQHLAPLQELRRLQLAGTAINDAAIDQLPVMQHLEYVSLRGTAITDRAVKQLTAQPQLKSLVLADTRVTDACLTDVAQLKQLQSLHLAGCPHISDAGARQIATLAVTELLISDTGISAAGLKHIESMQGLRFLQIGGPNITAASAKALQTALPHCRILHIP